MFDMFRLTGPRGAARRAALRLEQYEDRAVPAAGVGTTFAGGSGATAPDGADGAIGVDHYVQLVDGRFAVYTRDGTLALSKTDEQFWVDAGIAATLADDGLSDARVYFDPLTPNTTGPAGRWYLVAATDKALGNSVLVARSNTINPTGTWKAVSYVGAGATLFAATPTLGVDATGVYVGTVDSDAGGVISTTLTSIPKADLYATTPTLNRKTTITRTNRDMGSFLQGVTNQDPSPARASVIGDSATDLGKVVRTTLTGTGTSSPIVGTPAIVSVDPTSNPMPVRQPDGTRTVTPPLDDRFAAMVYQVGDLIVGVHTISVDAAGEAATGGPGTTNGIRVTVLSDLSIQVLAEATYFDNAYDYQAPSVAMNAFGDMVIGFTRSSANAGSGATDGNLGAYAVQAYIDPEDPGAGIAFGDEVQLAAGLAPDWHLGGGATQPWGDHSATATDRANQTSFWTTQLFARTGGTAAEWGTQVSQVYVSPRASHVTSVPSGGSFGVGAILQVKVHFNDAVVVTGTPRVALNTGGVATYVSGSGTDTLTFHYQVQAGQYTTDLNVSGDATIDLNGGTIRSQVSALDVEPALDATGPNSLASSSNVVIDTTPRVVGVDSTAADGVYGPQAVIPITVTFTGPVTVAGGTPRLELNTGAFATYAGGSGSSTLTFNYTVGAGEFATSLDYASATSLDPNGASIRDALAPVVKNAILTLPAPGAPGSLAHATDLVIDPAVPSVVDVTSPVADGPYGFGAVIPITMTFTKPVNVTGTPRLLLNSGGTAAATYTSGSGTTTLTFTYTVGAGDFTTELDYDGTLALDLNGGAITEPFNNRAASLDLPAPGTSGSLGAGKDIAVDARVAAVTGVTSPVADGPYGFGAVIPIRVTFDKVVTVSGAPTLALNSGGTATYASGSGTSTLTFNYTVGANHFTTDLDYTGGIALNGGVIADQATGAAADIDLPAPGAAGSLGAGKDISVDARVAQVTGVTSPVANGSYGLNAVIPIRVTFDKPVTVSGTPTLALNSGGTATYASGSGTTVLTFNYTVGTGDLAADLDYTGGIALTGGAAITDQATSTPADIDLPAPGAAGSLGAGKNIAVDAAPATVVAFRVRYGSRWYDLVGAQRTLLPWKITAVQVVFSKPVATGTAQSLTGLTATRLRGLGTNTLTWTLPAIVKGEFTAGLATAGPNALRDRFGNSVAGFTQDFAVLFGDVNGDRVVNAADETVVRASLAKPFNSRPPVNVFADLSGDGLVNLVDVTTVRSRKGQSLPS